MPEIQAWSARNPEIALTGESNNWWMLYSSCLDSLKGRADRQDFIFEIMKSAKTPNLSHVLLAHLMRKGLTRTVLTTNFDDLLDQALRRFNERVAELSSESVEELTLNSKFLQIVYLHGKLMSYHQRHTEAEINRVIPGLESFLTEALKRNGLVIVGYRGGRETPMEVLVKILKQSVHGPGRPVFWVSHASDSQSLSEKAQELLAVDGTYLVSGCSADDFLKGLCSRTVGLPAPGDFTSGGPTTEMSDLWRSAPRLVHEAKKKWPLALLPHA
jgi:hypothetical protein